MGYCVSMTDRSVRIKSENLDAAYKVVCELNNRNDLKHGGAWPLRPENEGNPNPHDQIWFSWMDWDYPDQCPDLKAVLEAIRFEVSEDFTGGLSVIQFEGEKIGPEEYFLDALAPYIEPGGYIEWLGEDGEKWRQDFDGETMTVRYGKTVWE